MSTLHSEGELSKRQIWSCQSHWDIQWYPITTEINCQSSFLWYPVSSLKSSLACLYNLIITHSPCVTVALLQRHHIFALLCCFAQSTLSDFIFLSFKTRFSWSFLWTPRALLHIFLITPIPPCGTLLIIVVCLSHDNMNSLRTFICGSSGSCMWWVQAYHGWNAFLYSLPSNLITK